MVALLEVDSPLPDPVTRIASTLGRVSDQSLRTLQSLVEVDGLEPAAVLTLARALLRCDPTLRLAGVAVAVLASMDRLAAHGRECAHGGDCPGWECVRETSGD